MRLLSFTLLLVPGLVWAQARMALQPVDDEPRHLASVRGTAQAGTADVFAASVTLHAIPFVDLETTWGAAEGLSARAGPRWTLGDRRSRDHCGPESRLLLLAGMKGLYSADAFLSRGLNVDVVAALDGTWWVEPHFGINAQVVAGVAYFPTVVLKSIVPDVRFAVGVSF